MYEIKIRDLRLLSTDGNITAKLDKQYNFKIAKVKKDGVYHSLGPAFVNGKKAIIELREDYPTIFSHIVNVKKGNVLMAERVDGKLVGTWKFEQEYNKEKRY